MLKRDNSLYVFQLSNHSRQKNKGTSETTFFNALI